MSQFPPAFTFSMDIEDPKRLYRKIPDVGGFAISGINSAAWPSDFSKIDAVPEEQRSALVYNFYQKNFWSPLKIGGLNSQEVCNRVYDHAVNSFTTASIKLLQKSLNVFGFHLEVDGDFGPVTMNAANSIDQDRLLAAFRESRVSFYKKVVDNNPEDAKYLKGWETRARL